MSRLTTRRSRSRAVLQGGLLYFLVVFGCGFVLGLVRTLWVAPVLGERRAELLELPFMLLASYLAARWIVGRFEALDDGASTGLALGSVALALLVGAEAGLVLLLRDQSLSEYVAGRDPVSGTGYLISLLLFALMPALAAARSGSR